MSIKESFTEDEWFLLSATPAWIAAAVSASDKSSMIGIVKELSAGMRTSIAGLKDYPDSELVQQLLEKADNWDAAKEKMTDYKSRTQEHLDTDAIKSPEDLQQQVLADIRRSTALADSKCTPDDAQIYREWCLKIANNVASASKEGGFLGFGGTPVSDAERALITQIEEASGVSSSTLLA